MLEGCEISKAGGLIEAYWIQEAENTVTRDKCLHRKPEDIGDDTKKHQRHQNSLLATEG